MIDAYPVAVACGLLDGDPLIAAQLSASGQPVAELVVPVKDCPNYFCEGQGHAGP